MNGSKPMPPMRYSELRILMASGVGQTEVRFSQAKPDRFIQRPFTAEEFRQEVMAALAA